MYLILKKDGAVVDFPPILTGSNFYYADGMIGCSAADADWTGETPVLDEAGQPTNAVAHWTLEAAPPPEAPPAPPTPEQLRARMPTLSPVQFRKMLRGQGITAAMVEAAIAGIADENLRADASDAWEYATFFERLNPLIDMIGALLGLTPEQIDAAWLGAVDA